MYKLTLTKDERRAFHWVGNRYNAGEIFKLLEDCEEQECGEDDMSDVTYHVPEHVAWEIQRLAQEENNMWPCFSGTLALKLNKFLTEIV